MRKFSEVNFCIPILCVYYTYCEEHHYFSHLKLLDRMIEASFEIVMINSTVKLMTTMHMQVG